MKKFLLFVLLPVLSIAAPKVGDFVQYDVRLELDGNQMDQGTVRMEILEQNAAGLFLEKSTVILDQNGTQSSEEWKAADKFMSKEDIEQIAPYGLGLTANRPRLLR